MLSMYRDVLMKSSLFKGIEPQELDLVLKCLKPKVGQYKKNEPIVLTGDSFNEFGLILKGEALVIKENSAGKRIMMTILKPGDLFGEMIAFSTYSIWLASVETQRDCIVLFISNDKILGQCEHACPWHNKLIANMLKIISEKALLLNKKVEYLAIKSIRKKICTFLLEQYNKTGQTTFMLPMKRGELADFLNVSRPSLSRELSRLRDEGLLEYHLSSVRIINLEQIKKAIE